MSGCPHVKPVIHTFNPITINTLQPASTVIHIVNGELLATLDAGDKLATIFGRL